jgi:flagellar protein FliL
MPGLSGSLSFPRHPRPMSKPPEKIADPETDGSDPKPATKSFGKKKPILLGAPVVLIGAVAGLWFSGVLPGLLGMRHDDPHAQEAAKSAVPIFVDLPDMIANLNSPQNKPSYIKLQARLEVSRAEDAEKIRQDMPRLQDMFQTYLREMRPEELRGSPGIYRLREELLGRANVAVAPVRVNDVLFTQLLIQ